MPHGNEPSPDALPICGTNREAVGPGHAPPEGHRPLLELQSIRKVGIRELRDPATLRSIADAERLVVTRHGDPQAVVLSVRDAMELVAAPRAAECAVVATRDLAVGNVIEPWPEVRWVRIVIARSAADRFERTAAQDRFALRKLLIRGDFDSDRPLWVPSGRRLVPFSLHDPGEGSARDLVLVHDLIDARELERELIGEEIWQARHRRDIDRVLHARTPLHRAWKRER